jgi:hypothetical protein
MATVISANVTNIKIGGNDAPGLQAIEYKIVRNRQNIHNIGHDERIGVLYGPMHVTGLLRFRSTNPYLDELIATEIKNVGTKEEEFQIVVEFKGTIGAYAKKTETTLVFDECHVEGKSFSIDANGIGVSDYTFTAARVREE